MEKTHERNPELIAEDLDQAVVVDLDQAVVVDLDLSPAHISFLRRYYPGLSLSEVVEHLIQEYVQRDMRSGA